MSDIFKSPLRRLARANTHIAGVERIISDYVASEPLIMETLEGYDNLRKALLILLRPTHTIPEECGDLAIEAMDALRSALDQACYSSAISTGSVSAKYAYFPFADSAEELAKVIKGRCKDIHPEIVDLLRAFEPTPDGNKLLWAFNKARQSNQHKISRLSP